MSPSSSVDKGLSNRGPQTILCAGGRSKSIAHGHVRGWCMIRSARFALIALCLLAACRGGKSAQPLFELLTPSETGVTFANTIATSDSVNVQSDVYLYNGAGVGAGDIDNDGLPDLFFAGNMVSSRLYLNKGQMRFEDITKRSGVATNRWATGVTMVDIDNDGFLDIYVSVSGLERSKPEQRA